MFKLWGLVFVALTVVSSLAQATPEELACINRSTKIDQKLACLKSVTVKETVDTSVRKGTRLFDIQFEQVVDVNDPSAGTFKQHLVLIHRDENEPVILETSGYNIFGIRDSTVSAMFGANQIQVEHRYFSTSKPDKLDWSRLDIKRSADDFHAITMAFKQIYPKHWINTGASKGGMTSLYYRRFYPDDLDGTLADVAPLSFGTADKRYDDFLAQVGGDEFKECREAMTQMQINLLKNRDQLVPKLKGNFNQLGSVDVAFEHSVIELYFFFWQYQHPDDVKVGCKAIPSNDDVQKQFAYLEGMNPVSEYSDEEIQNFYPYYYQSATQLGGPDSYSGALDSLRHFDFTINQYTPKGLSYSFADAPMHDIDSWARTTADKIIYIYGQLDPWSGGQFPLSEAGKETYRYVVPGGNHGSEYSDLPDEQKEQAIAALSRWLDKAPLPEVEETTPTPFRAGIRGRSLTKVNSLRQVELQYMREHHLN